MAQVKIIFGTATPLWFGDETGPQVLEILEKEGIHNIDTARNYGPAEELLGKRGASKKFIIDTKNPGGFDPTPATKEAVLESAQKSLDALKTEQVDIYYLHAPDRRVPLAETLEAINEVHKQGSFKRFGLSNFLPDEVEEVIQVAKEKGFVLPTVYQGNYSVVARKAEDALFPILRRNNIALYVYSPIAGGFLTKTPEEVLAGAQKFDPDTPTGKIYATLYNKPSFLEALKIWGQISEETGISKAELAYRWVAYHSAVSSEKGDAVIVGARTPEQLTETIEGLRNGPLPGDAPERINAIWDIIKDDAGLDNFNLNNA